MPNIRGVLADVKTALDEDQALLALIGALGGAAGAFIVKRYGPEPDPAILAITIDQARASLLAALALVFTGLSIVLALTALATGNMANNFSPRLLRMKLRSSGNKWVLGVFAATATFIVTSQILLRSDAGDELAPPLTMSVSVLMLIISGVMIVWYINGTLQSLRVDRAIRWIGWRIDRAVEGWEYEARHDVVVSALDIDHESGAIDLEAAADGYVVNVDTNRLAGLAEKYACRVVVECGTGCPVVRGQRVGWVAGPTPILERHLAEIVDCLTIADARDPEVDIGYTIDVLVDIGLMALSPAVNDPRTGAECAEMLTIVCCDLARRPVGSRTRIPNGEPPSVVVVGNSMGDYLDAAGRQLLLYGANDRTVTAALLRLGREAERAAQSDRDRRLARVFADDVEALRAASTASHGRSW